MDNGISRVLTDWFAGNARALPWRAGYDPYGVWISEVMLQQTQMERAVDYWRRWMRELPSPAAVAGADEDVVLKLWEGLGYYSRARNLRKAARVMVAEHGGRVPDTREALLALPGVGPYTAAAVLSIAYGRDEALVDANVARVFSRVFDLDAPVAEASTRRRIEALARELLPPGRAREHNQALMELGALVCRKRPDCGVCPLAGRCEARRLGIVEHRPVPGRRKDIIPLSIATGVLVHQGRVFIQRRRDDDVWGGLWEFPGGCIEEGEAPEDTVVREFDEETGFAVQTAGHIRTLQHGYTRYRVTLHCYFLSALNGLGAPTLTEATAARWVTPDELDRYAFPAGHRKLIDSLDADERFRELIRESRR